MSFGTMLFNLIIGPLKMLFELIFALVNRFGSPGISIVALSLCMNLLVLPLYRRADAIQDEERETEARLAPGVEHIRKTFTGDQRFMTLQTYYRQNHYSQTHALKGALPLLLEIPFFIAAYQFLSGLEILKQASFGPIADLGAPDTLLSVGGMTIHLLPILMTLINLISSEIYTNGAPLKSKIQLYVMALVFLVFLYNSPSGLTLYWTLNNLFSLVKNVITRLLRGHRSKRASKLPAYFRRAPNLPLFFLAGAFMALLTGALIPSAVIASSPSEFIEARTILNPLWYVVNSLLLATGTFVVWFGIFYLLGNTAMKKGLELVMWVLSGTAVINYMAFHADFGILSPTLKFEVIPVFTWGQKLLNLGVLCIAAGILIFILIRWEQLAKSVCLVGAIAVMTMTVINAVQAQPVIRTSMAALQSGAEGQIHIPLNKKGKNVMVLMLDRAISAYVPSMFAEKPELMDSFDGFTWYSNTLSHGPFTNFGTPGIFGGYDYTPWESNKRSDMTLAQKQDEALKVLPTLLGRDGYDVTVIDPPYAGSYAFIPDLSIYDGMENVRAYRAVGNFTYDHAGEGRQHLWFRNFFSYALCETSPWLIYGTLYNVGYYNETNHTFTLQVCNGISKSTGSDMDFIENYGVLNSLPEFTEIQDAEQNTLLLMDFEMTHTPQLLQTPDYVPYYNVNNMEYDASHMARFTDIPKPIRVTTENQMIHYHVNMAAFLKLGSWFKMLREQGVYDNTRIILVSDHGRNLALTEGATLEDGEDLYLYHALLMVKDFDSHGALREDSTFMTNADVPTLVLEDLVDSPVNPFTGKPINGRENRMDDQIVTISHDWDTGSNRGSTFSRSKWYRVDHEVLDPKAWSYMGEY